MKHVTFIFAFLMMMTGFAASASAQFISDDFFDNLDATIENSMASLESSMDQLDGQMAGMDAELNRLFGDQNVERSYAYQRHVVVYHNGKEVYRDDVYETSDDDNDDARNVYNRRANPGKSRHSNKSSDDARKGHVYWRVNADDFRKLPAEEEIDDNGRIYWRVNADDFQKLYKSSDDSANADDYRNSYKSSDDEASARNTAQQDTAVDHNQPYSMYAFLNDYERWVYDTIYPALSSATPTLSVNENIEKDALMTAISAVRYDHPEFVWMNEGYHRTVYPNYEEIDFSYNALADDYERYQQEFYQKAEQILSVARKKPTKLEQEKYIYEYLVAERLYEIYDLAGSAYAALVLGSAKCEGFALAFHYLLKQLDIPSYYVTGENHAWLVVNMDGSWYAVDPTTPQEANGYRFKTKGDIERFEKKYFNKRYSEYERSPDMSDFPNDRLFK